MKRSVYLLLLFCLVAFFVCLQPVSGQGSGPALPHEFLGKVFVGDSPAPVGLEVEAVGPGVYSLQVELEGRTITVKGNPVTTQSGGVYGESGMSAQKLLVQGDVEPGTPLEFYVGGVKAEVYPVSTNGPWKENYSYFPGDITELNLRIAGQIPVGQTREPTPVQTRLPASAVEAFLPEPGKFTVSTNKMNDYPHFGVWPSAYFMMDHQFQFPAGSWAGAGVFAFDRAKMLAGDPSASFIYFDLFGLNPNIGGLLPADLDGPPPPAGRSGYFSYPLATVWGDPIDGLRIYEFQPNFTTPARSTFTERPESPIAVAAWDPNMCNYARSCIPQPPAVPPGLRSLLWFAVPNSGASGTPSRYVVVVHIPAASATTLADVTRAMPPVSAKPEE